MARRLFNVESTLKRRAPAAFVEAKHNGLESLFRSEEHTTEKQTPRPPAGWCDPRVERRGGGGGSGGAAGPPENYILLIVHVLGMIFG